MTFYVRVHGNAKCDIKTINGVCLKRSEFDDEKGKDIISESELWYIRGDIMDMLGPDVMIDIADENIRRPVRRDKFRPRTLGKKRDGMKTTVDYFNGVNEGLPIAEDKIIVGADGKFCGVLIDVLGDSVALIKGKDSSYNGFTLTRKIFFEKGSGCSI